MHFKSFHVSQQLNKLPVLATTEQVKGNVESLTFCSKITDGFYKLLSGEVLEELLTFLISSCFDDSVPISEYKGLFFLVPNLLLNLRSTGGQASF